MKKLIAKRPIQYMGRTYEPGDTIPAHDSRMVEAWLNAESAAWTGGDQEQAAQGAKEEGLVDHMAACVLRNMGVTIQDESGEFVGADALEEQIRNLAWDGQGKPLDGQENGTGNQTQENSQGTGAPEMVTGHLDAADLERWKKVDLEKLAADMGMDISAAKNNAERAALLAAVPVQAPADGHGGTQ